MKNYFKILTTILALMAVFLMPEMGWGQTQYTLTIDKSYFNTTSYAANNGDHTTVAYKVGDQSTTKSITWTSNQIMLQTDLMQWQKNNGYIYNKTDLGTINSVTVNSSAGSFTTYYGTSEHPTSGTTVGNGFFTTQVGNATGKTSSIVITFTIGSSSYTITPQSNNTSYGTVSLSGNTITATPNTGYRVSTSTPYNVSPSGSATVAQNGNIFTVTPSANTTVTINFEAIPTYTVTFNVGNGTFDGNTDFPSTSNTVAAGTYTLPSATPSSLCSTNGWNFAGWSTASVNETTTAPAILTGSYTLSDNASLYAVYSVAEGGGGNTNTSNVFSSGTFSNDVITWAISGVVTVKQERNGSGNTAPNSSYVSAPRWYSGNLITITPSVSINSITIEANTENYATALRNSTYTNASASVTGTTVTITPTNGSNPITIEMGAQSRLSSMIVNYSSGTTTYATSPSCASLLSTSVNINSSGITNTDVYSGTATGLLSATVTETESGDPVSGATVTWTSSDEGVATINASGVVTLVAAGTTTITASYAGVANQYQASSATYTLTVTDSNPAQIYHYDFQGANNFYTDAALTTHPSYASGNNVGTIYYGDGSVFVASGDNRYFSTANLGTGYFLLGKTGAEISLPTFAGYKITQVKLHSSSGHSTNVSVSIVSGSNTASVAQTWSTKDHEYVYNIASDYQTSPLSVKVTNDYNTQFTGIDIVCEASTDPIIYASDVNLAYTATSGSINYTITNPVTGANLSASTGDWLTVGNFDTEHNILYLSCTANTTAMVRTAIVTFNYMYGGNVIATKEVTVTQEADPNALHNISDITAVGTYKVRGTIVAKSTIGFVVGDGTGYIYYYKGSEPSNNIGDMVKLEGPVVVYGGVFEFNNQATITAATESNYHTEDPMVLSGSILDATLASSETHLSYFVQYQGTLVVDPGKATHYNITDIDGAETAEGSISYPINTDFASLDGKEVIVTGYYVGKSGNKYINTMLGTIERNCDGTTVTITPSITNTDVYTGTSAGSLSATVTETEGGNAVSGATVTWTSSNTSVATVDASGNVTLVAAGTTTITASYAGVANTYCESSATYELIVTDSSPVCNIDGTITFGNGNNGTISINSANVTGDDSLDNSWTITTEGTTSFTPNADYSQVGSSSKPATSITFTTTLPSSVKISGFSAKFGGFNGTVGDVTLKVGNNVVGTGSLNGTNDVIVVNNMEAEGNTLTVLVENIDKGVICYYISYSSTAVSAPTFSLPSGGYVGEQYVSIACETPDATIHYTTDGSNPTESSSVYSSPITVGTGVTTLKAIAYTEDCESAISEATYTICASVPNAPVITISGDECDNPRTVTITGDGGVTIYYTTDNSYPTTESTVYSSPFNLTATTTVRAIAVDNGCPSNEAFEICTITPLSGDYEKVTSNLVDWSGEYVIAHSGTGDTKVLSGCNSYGTSTSYGTSEAFGTISNVLASSYVDSYKVIIEKEIRTRCTYGLLL